MSDSNNDAKIILEKVDVKSCDSLVSPPSVATPDGSGVATQVTCSNGWDMGKTIAHTQVGTEVVNGNYKDSGYVLQHEVYHGKCVCNVAWDIWQGWPGGRSKWKTNPNGGVMGSGWESYRVYEVNGFKCVCDLQNCNEKDAMKWDAQYVHQGDTAAMAYAGSVGHGVIFNGKYWVSDTIQSSHGAIPGHKKICSKYRVYRKPECKPNSSNESSKQSRISRKKTLNIEYRREIVTKQYSYGKIYIDGVYFCDACDVGLEGSLSSYSKKGISKPISGTYDLWFSKNKMFTEYANNPQKYYQSIEFGKWYNECKINESVYVPSIGTKDGICKDYQGKSHSGVKIYGGRGSINSACSIILGKSGGKKIGNSFYFAKENSSTEKNEDYKELTEIYQEHWDVYKEFWSLCKDISGGEEGKIGTIKLTMPRGY